MSTTQFGCHRCLAKITFTGGYTYADARQRARQEGWRQVLLDRRLGYAWCCPACVAERKRAKGEKT